jgi:iron complex outermembrane recepter protein
MSLVPPLRLLATLAAFALTASPASLHAQAAPDAGHTLSGRVTDEAGTPLEAVRVTVPALGRMTLTAADGRFRLRALPAGSHLVTFARVGRAPETRQVRIADADAQLDVRMRESLMALAPVQVTATTAATRPQDTPQATAVLEGPELRVAQGGAVGDVLEQIPGVRSLSMTSGIGKPVIRGLTHYRVVTLDNGQRTETQAWGHDHSPNVETAAAERVEVIKGPSSVLYGSDALGGVINVVAPALPDAIDSDPFVRGRASGGYDHNTRGGDGTLVLEGAAGGLGARGALTRRATGEMRTPAGLLGNTTNEALSSELALGHRGVRGSMSLRWTGRDERIGIFDDPVRNPGYTGFQRIATSRAAADVSASLPGARVQLSGGWERNFRREYANAGATTPDLGLLVQNWTGFAHLHHEPIGPFRGTLGVSGMTSRFSNRGSVMLIPDSDTRTAAAYLFEQVERGRWTGTLGARYDARTLSTTGEPRIGVPPHSRRFGAFTGSAGALYRLSEPVSLVLSLARGFRAPAAPDLFANGFHEGTRAFERGDPTLRVETSLNRDLGIRVSRSDFTGELTGFLNRIDDYIYLRPTGTGARAFDSLQVVQGDARLVGVEGRLAWRPRAELTLQLGGDYVRGDNLTSHVPLTFIPPLRVQYGIRYEPRVRGALHRPYLSLGGETNARQSRLDPRDVGPPGYTLATLGAGFGWQVPRGVVTVDLQVRNLGDVRYRSFMSRYKEFALGPGRTMTLKLNAPL